MNMRFPFFPKFEDLPRTLPVFPLDDAIVMPGAELPLNIFEPRYLKMVEDALKTDHMFGMIQPDLAKGKETNSLYSIGCAGQITAYSETADGRILLSLTGLIRFGVIEELPSIRGYRLVVPDWGPYASDLDRQFESDINDKARLTHILKDYLKSKNMETDWKTLKNVSGTQLLEIMAMLPPIGSAEKQAILEAKEPNRREAILLAALELSLQNESGAFRH